MKILKKTFAVLLLFCISHTVYALPNSESAFFEMMTNYATNLYIDETITTEELKNAALEEILKDNPELMYKMVKAVFSSLDDYSEFFTEEEYKEYVDRVNNVFYGMGVIIQKKENDVEVIKVYEDGGAKAAGVLEGDILTCVEGKSVEGLSLDQITELIAGEEGTFVKITVMRKSQPLNFLVERKAVETNSVAYGVLPGEIGYIEISNFAQSTPEEFETAIANMKEKEIEKVILDLRNNPGGILDSVIGVARQVVPKGAITHTIYRYEEANETYESTLEKTPFEFVVLVNENTASAAEVLTGAMQDSKAGYVVGTVTYGKGVIQNIYNLSNGDVFKLTTGHYLTRDGHDINNTGIEPDEVVINNKKPIDLNKYKTFDYKTKWHVGQKGEGVLAAKQRLSVLGYYSGVQDEVFDKELENAVNKFQKDTGLFPYGVLDISTQATLENNFYVLEEIEDNQFFKAYEYLGGNVKDLE